MADKAGQVSGIWARIFTATVFAATVSACTSSTPPLGLASPEFSNSAAILASNLVELNEDGDPVLPDEVLSYPSARPELVAPVADEEPVTNTLTASAETDATTVESEPSGTESLEKQPAAGSNPIAPTAIVQTAAAPSSAPATTPTPGTEKPAGPAAAPAVATASETEPEEVETSAPVQKRGFFASLFSNQKKPQAPVVNSYGNSRDGGNAFAPTRPIPRKRVLTAGASGNEPRVALASISANGGLPGVRERDLFEIKRRSGLDDDSDIDSNEADTPVRLASAAGLARLAPNGLLTQHSGVDVKCLKPSLVRVLKTVERRYGKRVVVTSGYRSPRHNKRVRGARNSLHMYCAAADIQVQGVSKWTLAKYLRALPGRGGVGTYCHTNSVHIDVGPERDWNWRCRRRRKRS